METFLHNTFAALGPVEPWHWWALGAILIVLEMVTPTFYFMWPGIAAVVTGLVLILVPDLAIEAQLLLFAVLSVAATVAWKRYAPRDWLSAPPHPTLNQRSAQYVGRRGKAADFSNGRGAVFLDDTRWSAVSADGSDPANGETVEIVGFDGAVLRVKAV
jgi:membrane protein implicated in regulation of membrane protease activity